ncbi:27S pre-rRNA (guanosine2922-2'-O)-methyltransferase [Starmerella bacillaris]|uniref:27S pre-rRNA (Guanosine2922-2'-O)-methyltransferase n=1 Tax=Starmerella bacillaris TaxID=1247836 RepID=A0AAV5RFD8_STABA|nr:27S pre-rRNA (guanosine2922-2'-O)-methyltransferase [Starmerella bacillaris]
MGKAEKKYGKGRLDHYYRLAKERGYRARSSFKIIQLNQKYGFFTAKKQGKPMCVIDLCAAPGSWCQVATQCLPLNSLIVGVDLAPIKPLPNVITFQSDITTDHCRSQLRGYLKTWKADVVMHDGAPNVGMAWAQDAFTQSELVLQSLKLAVEFLAPGGWFITKVFRSKDYNKLMWVFNQFFDKCEATKPPSSRNVSAEIFVVCKGFKAPAKVDPRLLDPVYVFEEIQDVAQNHQQKVFNPEKKTRKRDGYKNDEGKLVLAQTTSALDFVRTEDPITMLGENTAFIWDKTDPEIIELKKLPQTTTELLECFKDLKVLGKKDFRTILRWRKIARKHLHVDDHDEEEKEEVETLTTDELIDKELTDLSEAQQQRLKRERRKRNERKQKELIRMRMQNGAAGDIIAESMANGRDGLFDLNKVRKAGQAEALVRGKQQALVLKQDNRDIVLGDEDDMNLDDIPDSSDSENSANEDAEEEEEDSEAEAEHLANELDAMYDNFKEMQAKSAQARALRNRETAWHGFESNEEDSDLEDDEEEADQKPLSGRAAMFFDNPVFNTMEVASDSEEADSESDMEADSDAGEPGMVPDSGVSSAASTSPKTPEDDEEEDAEEGLKTSSQVFKEGERDLTDEAIKMTLAQKLALGQITKHDLINEGYNKVSFRDRENLPEWFLEDEAKHTRYMKPITKEAALAAKEAMKALNARPIKKVTEAKMRKKMRAQRRLEKIRKKSDLINEDSSISERDKSEEIAKLMRRATTKTRPKLTVVAAKGKNRGLQGRPGGVRGKYKMVDGTMKKEQRALKRIAKKRK